MNASDEYWLEFLRRPEVQRSAKLQQKIAIKENAANVVALTQKAYERLSTALLHCDPETRAKLSPLIEYPECQRFLHTILETCENEKCSEEKQTGNGPATDLLYRKFNEKLTADVKVREELQRYQEQRETAEEELRRNIEKYEEMKKIAQSVLEPGSVQSQPLRSWRDLPQEELAERLSKGEILPKDEWIPGVSEGKKKITGAVLDAHVDFAMKLNSEGTEEYKKKSFEMALTRYTQGVRLLEWVTGVSTEETSTIEEWRLKFLKNQAQAALQLGRWQEAKSASTEALTIDEHDLKALFRRGQANVMLGDVVGAKRDYVRILKDPYCDTSASMAARQGLKEIRNIIYKNQADVNKLLEASATDEAFSANRDADENSLEREKEKRRFEQMQKDKEMALRRRLGMLDTTSETTLSNDSGSRKSPGDVSPTEMMKESHAPVVQEEPELSLDETLKLQEALLELYTRPEVEKELIKVRSEADLNERRTLIRLRRKLPEILEPLLDELQFHQEMSFHERRQKMERCIAHWRARDDRVRDLSIEIYKALVGHAGDF